MKTNEDFRIYDWKADTASDRNKKQKVWLTVRLLEMSLNDFKLSPCYIFDVELDFRYWHRVEVGYVADISEKHVASTIRTSARFHTKGRSALKMVFLTSSTLTRLRKSK
jgi:hypothetical protein